MFCRAENFEFDYHYFKVVDLFDLELTKYNDKRLKNRI